ncbi:hypothetical protein GQ42DRAFT_164702 [Ramicandelaber brevisporus]|nr:hypothetical protein GQ42DRAFT_164702 [Ramicandelaber brevisporus]
MSSEPQPVSLEGTLSKWTNYAGGWRKRYFMLVGGVLSYYKEKSDVQNASRGAINLGAAQIEYNHHKDKTQFEVVAKGAGKYLLRAASPEQAREWVFALKQSKAYSEFSNRKAQQQQPQQPHQPQQPQQHPEQHPEQTVTSSSAGSPTLNLDREAVASSNVRRSFTGTSVASSQVSTSRPAGGRTSMDTLSSSGTGLAVQNTSPSRSPSAFSVDVDDDKLPHESEFESTVRTVQTQLDAHQNVLFTLRHFVSRVDKMNNQPSGAESDTASVRSVSGTGSGTSPPSASVSSSLASGKSLLDTALHTLDAAKQLFGETVTMARERESYWKRKYHNEIKRQDDVMESLREVELERQKLENIARSATLKVKKAKDTLRAVGASHVPTAESIESASPGITTAPATVAAPVSSANLESSVAAIRDMPEELRNADSDADDDDDNDEEFYDAVGGGSSFASGVSEGLEKMALIPDSELVPAVNEMAVISQANNSSSIIGDKEHPFALSFCGYPIKGDFRKNLGIQGSSRPSISFWAILRNAIGKELTKISMPVVFNEPSSNLQRLAEDMEYGELLDIASSMELSSERILWVAAFAMSNYSSTVGRVYKPFNPLQGETFEYVRPDKQYRYIAEQVSHHPPISACHCESTNFEFYAEANMKTKFWGKSLEVLPAGENHVHLKVPVSYLSVPEEKNVPAPKKFTQDGSRFYEHYAWRKVTTSVQGLMAGRPWIEHYGDMVVTNYRTGEVCTLTFKQRAWLSNDIFQIEGTSVDRSGNTVWEIGGSWNDKLVARYIDNSRPNNLPVGKELDLDSDHLQNTSMHQVSSTVSTTSSTATTTTTSMTGSVAGGNRLPRGRPILLWKRIPLREPPPLYNFTDFTMSLNEMCDGLDSYLCPTDSRFRPDQRALENAEYDLASSEKNRVEELQRGKRKSRAPELGPWKPRWFDLRKDTDTGETYWHFNGEYWQHRDDAVRAKTTDSNAKTWTDSDIIY